MSVRNGPPGVMFAPSRAHRNAIARPMPLLAPMMKMVLSLASTSYFAH
jgi:hypothetical protein